MDILKAFPRGVIGKSTVMYTELLSITVWLRPDIDQDLVATRVKVPRYMADAVSSAPPAGWYQALTAATSAGWSAEDVLKIAMELRVSGADAAEILNLYTNLSLSSGYSVAAGELTMLIPLTNGYAIVTERR
jgi:hypothetical protein